jgi:subtilase family serine protease
MRLLTRIGVAAVAVGTLSSIALTSAADAASSRASVAGTVPQWAKSSAFKGNAAGTGRVGFRVYLGWRNGTAAATLARSVSTPGSKDYGHFLSPAAFRNQFAPTQSQVTAVQRWLRNAGFTVRYTPANNHYVAAEGTVAQANKAFATTLGTYAYKGMRLLAPEKTLSVPASLPRVSGVIGLDGTDQLLHYDHAAADPRATPSAGFRNAPPLSTYWDEKNTNTTDGPDGTHVPGGYPWAQKGHAGATLQNVYGVDPATADGSGVTVAIIDAYASPTIVQDSSTYFANHGLPAWQANQFSQVVAPGTFRHPEKGQKQDPQGWYGEETLDVEAVHTMAPGANVVFVGSPNNFQDMDAALNHVVDRHLASIVSNSYGWSGEALPPGFVKPQEDTLVQAAAEGIGVYFSSGDSGDETDGTSSTNFAGASPDWPASSPFVTAVGGTSLAAGDTTDGTTRRFETGWETTKSSWTDGAWTDPFFLYGSGGGASRLFTQPSWQQGVVPTSMSNPGGTRPQAMRTIPDVSMVGDPNTGMLVGQTQAFPDGNAYDEYRIGGTSLSCPLFAGLMADAQQQRGSVIGFANPALYAAGSSAYNDVLSTTATLATQPVPADEDWSAVARSDYVNGVDGADGYLFSRRGLGQDGGLTIHSAPGFDDVTGLGTPKAGAFFPALLAALG